MRVLAAGMIVLAAALPRATPGIADPLQHARGHVLSGDRDRARALLDSLLAAPEGDRFEEAAFLRAMLEEDGELLERRLHRVLAGDPRDDRRAAAHLLLGRAAFARADLVTALDHFETARKEGRTEEGSLWAGLAAMALGDGERTRNLLTAASQSGNPRVRDRALMGMGDLHRTAGFCNEAVGWYQRVRDAGTGGPGWWAAATYRQAECLESLGRFSEANERMQEILDRTPGAYEAPLARSRLRLLRDASSEPAPAPGPESPSEDAPAPAVQEFSVQAGAFSIQDNAATLAGKLAGAGFEEVRVVETEAGLYRVLVGRFSSRDQAESTGDSVMTAVGTGFSIVRVDARP